MREVNARELYRAEHHGRLPKPSTGRPQIDFNGFLAKDTRAATKCLLAAADDGGLRELLQDGLGSLDDGDKVARACAGIATGVAKEKHGDRAVWLALIDATIHCVSTDNLHRVLKVICEAVDRAGCTADVWDALLPACCRATTSPDRLLQDYADCLARSGKATASMWIALVERAASTDSSPQDLVAYVAQTIETLTDCPRTVWVAIVTAAESLPTSSTALETLADSMGRAGVADADLWRRLMAAAKGLDPDEQKDFVLAVLKGLKNAPSWDADRWRAALGQASSIPDFRGKVVRVAADTLRKVATRDTALPDEVQAAWDDLTDIALSETGWSDKKRQASLGKLITSMSEAEVRSEPAFARCIDALCKQMGMGTLHQDFVKLGHSVFTQLLVNPTRKELEWESSPYASIYQAMLREAARTGKLGLQAIPEVADYRAEVMACAPSIAWNIVAAIPQAKFCGFSDLEKATSEWINSLKEMLCEMRQRGDALAGNPERRAVWGKLFREGIVPLLTSIAGGKALDKRAKPMVAIESVLGPAGSAVEVNAALLGKLIVNQQITQPATGGQAVKSALAESLLRRMNAFKAAVDASGLFADDAMGASIKGWTDACAVLTSLCASPDFADRYDKCYFYSVGPVDKDAVATLALGREVACCLSPEGDHFVEIIQRLVNPAWIPIAARDEKGTPVAVAWTVVGQMEVKGGGRKTVLVVDYCDSKRSYREPEQVKGQTVQNRLGNDVMDQTLAYVKAFAVAIRADAMYIGKQHHKRMDKFPVFTQLTYEALPDLQIVGPQFGPEDEPADRYTDNVGEGMGKFCEIDLRGKPSSQAAPGAI